MHPALEWIRSTAPPAAAVAVGWPWWAVVVVLFLSCGPIWAMAWLDVFERLRGIRPPGGRNLPPQDDNSDEG